MNFSKALNDIKDGRRMTRANWNAPGQFVTYQPGYPEGIGINANTATALNLPEGTVVSFSPYLMLRTFDGFCVPWAPTVSDVLADDWMGA